MHETTWVCVCVRVRVRVRVRECLCSPEFASLCVCMHACK